MVHISLLPDQLGLQIPLDVASRRKKEHTKVGQMEILTAKIETTSEAVEEGIEEEEEGIEVAEIGDEAEGDFKIDVVVVAVVTLYHLKANQASHRQQLMVKATRLLSNSQEEVSLNHPKPGLTTRNTHLNNRSCQLGHHSHLNRHSNNPFQACQICRRPCKICGKICTTRRLNKVVHSSIRLSSITHKEVRRINGTLKANRGEEVEEVLECL